MTPFSWWSHVIKDTLLGAGARQDKLAQVQDKLLPALVQRFWCREGYAIHDDVGPFFEQLGTLATTCTNRTEELAHPAVASGSDQGVIKVLKELDILRDDAVLVNLVFTTWQVEHDKRTKEFWFDVLRRLNEATTCTGLSELLPSEVLVVGDELVADCLTPMSCGMHALLLARPSTIEHARADYADGPGSDKVETIASLTDVVSWIERHNSIQSS
ncbi:hypothetical protein ACM66B_001163 [Microbotryomycetes sp. NB124-2]